ncbi:MAG: TIM barrel protein [Desulfarculaceae bacterium]
MQVLLHAWSLGTSLLSGKLRAHQLPALAVEAGFEGVEWLDRLLPSFEPSFWQELQQAQQEAGANSAALSLYLELNAPPTLVAEQVDRAKRLLGQCRLLNVRTVRVSVGGGGATLSRVLMHLERLRSATSRDQVPLGRLSQWLYRLAFKSANEHRHKLPPPAGESALQSAAWALQPLARQAQELGLLLGVENHFGLTAHPEDILKLIELTGQGLGVCLDLGNFCDDQDALAACRTLAPFTVHVHFKTLQPRPQTKDSGIDYAACLKALHSAGYTGAFSAEYQGRGEGLAGAKAGADLLRRLWEP